MKSKNDAESSINEKKSETEPKSTFTVVRETVESIVIAFVLALTFRTYIAEAFMIPTGSMANELMGRHKDIYCSGCGFRFKVGATEEVDRNTGRQINGAYINGVVCPNCRVGIDLSREALAGRDWPSHSGDRIIVGKYPYRMHKPDRWDVFVFMFPGNTQTNYIKRLVGMPNETLRIQNGDVFTRPLDSAEESDFQIVRKPADKILAVMQNVYDDDKRNLDFELKTNWPRRWIADKNSVWESEQDRSEYRCSASSNINWLVYQHVVPTFKVLLNYYQDIKSADTPDTRPSLITDMNAYNFTRMKSESFDPRQVSPNANQVGLHWTGDLIVECDLTPSTASGNAYLQLIKGGSVFTATINLANQTAYLSINGQKDWKPKASIHIKAGEKTHLRFANVDQALYLWINDQLVTFDSSTQYDALDNSLPTNADLNPARIGVEKVAVKVEHVKLFRDLYYIAAKRPIYRHITDFKDGILPFNEDSTEDMENFFRKPERWGNVERQYIQFDLHEGQYFALGDNSSHSEDSRLWGRPDDGIDFFVSEELLIGKAQFVFWPRPYNGFIPNVFDMRKVK